MEKNIAKNSCEIATIDELKRRLGNDILTELDAMLENPEYNPISRCWDDVLGCAIRNLLTYDYACTKYYAITPKLMDKYAARSGGCTRPDNARDVVTNAITFMVFNLMYNSLCKRYNKKIINISRRHILGTEIATSMAECA